MGSGPLPAGWYHGSLRCTGNFCSAPWFKVIVEDDGVEQQEEFDLSAEFVELMNMGEGPEGSIRLV